MVKRRLTSNPLLVARDLVSPFVATLDSWELLCIGVVHSKLANRTELSVDYAVNSELFIR